MPRPVSRTTTSTPAAPRRAATVSVPPPAIASRALRTRLSSTARSGPSSPRTAGSPAGSSRRTSTLAAASSGARKSSRLPATSARSWRPGAAAGRPGEAQVLLGHRVQPVHLARDGGAQGAGLRRAVAVGLGRLQLLGQQLGVEPEGVERVAHLVGDLGRDAPHRRQPLGPPELALLRGERGGHGVELAGQLGDLVLAGRLHLAREVAGGHRLHALR